MPLRYLLLFVALLLGALPSRAQGRFIWQKAIGTDADGEKGYQMIRLRQGDYLLAGSQGSRPYLVRVNEQGDTIWTRSYPAPGFNDLAAYSVAENRSGQVLVACNGGRYIGTSYNYDGLLMVVSSVDGSVFWSQAYQSPGVDGFISAQPANDGNFVLLATTLGNRAVWKIDSTGTLIWDALVPYDSIQSGGSFLVQPISSGYVVQNSVYSPSVASKLAFLNESGQFIYRKKRVFGNGFSQRCLVEPNGQLLFPGLATLKTTANGDSIWSRRYSVNGVSVGINALAATPDRGYIAVGSRYALNQYDICLWKLDADGQVIQDTVLYRQVGDEYAMDVALDAQGNYVVFGYTTYGWSGPSHSLDMVLLKLRPWTQTVGVPEEAAVQSDAHWQIYPNPTLGLIGIRRQQSGMVTGLLTVRDLSGRVLERFPVALTAEATVCLSRYEAGVYLLTLTPSDGDRPRTWRVVKQ